MMKTLSKFFNLSFVVIGLLLLSGCNNDDDNNGGGGPGPGDSELSGDITEDTTLDPSVTYTITGVTQVQDGVTLTIPAGTEIVSEVSSSPADAYYLAVLQGGSIDIQGTPSDPVIMRSNGNAGSWGGLVICGNATTTAGANAIAEVGGLSYGGNNDTDDSGSINYLIIRDAGAQINPTSQYNGLSLYAVGSQTSITNVGIINGADDGIEFFGGTVDASNIYLENNQDDAIDWTEGWDGTLSNSLVSNNNANFSTAVEADGQNNNPKLINLTAISATGGTGIQIKNDSGATIEGLTMTGFDNDVTLDFPDGAPVANLRIFEETGGDEISYSINSEGVAVDSEGDPVVFATSPTNAGDFGWATDPNIGDDNVLPTNITTDLQLDPSIQYRIIGASLVNNGATLTIPAGTEIVSDSGTANYLAVLQGGDIEIGGTALNPVVMRSSDGGDWGGLLICGNATTTAGVNAIAEVGGLVYGGNDDMDDSGSVEYLILRNTGAQINADSQFNGLSLYAVGSETTIDNVAVIDGKDDGIEFFGGTVNATNFYAENIQDDAVDWTEGWNGTLSTVLVSNTIANFSTAIEADGENNNPTINNFTAISSTGGTGIQIKNDSGATINGITMTGFDNDATLDFPDGAPVSNLKLFDQDGDEIVYSIDGNGEAVDSEGDPVVFASSNTNASNFAWATDDIDGGQLPANITGELTLDAGLIYTISGAVLVNDGAILNIPAGTEIVSDAGTANYLAVLKGGKINITGSAADPVVMRVEGNQGNWGGLLICGNATTTAGVDAIAEVGGLVYGGTDDEDDSGSIDYLVLRNTGAQINADSQFNGLSLYAVGSETVISNVAVVDGLDDGIEFFGGTVSATNFYAQNIQDDSVDWTEGWNGTLTNTFVKLTIANYSTAIEADGENNNPTLVNFTAETDVAGIGIQIKNDSGCTITGLTLSGFNPQFDFADGAPLSNCIVDGANADETANYNTSETVEADFDWVPAN